MEDKELQEVVDAILQALLEMGKRIDENFKELRKAVNKLEDGVREIGFDIEQIRLDQDRQNFEIEKIKRSM